MWTVIENVADPTGNDAIVQVIVPVPPGDGFDARERRPVRLRLGDERRVRRNGVGQRNVGRGGRAAVRHRDRVGDVRSGVGRCRSALVDGQVRARGDRRDGGRRCCCSLFVSALCRSRWRCCSSVPVKLGLMFAVSVNCALAPEARVGNEQVTLPGFACAGALQVAAGPVFCTSELNVVPAGNVIAEGRRALIVGRCW